MKKIISTGTENYISHIVFTRKTNPVVKYTIDYITLCQLISQIEGIERGDNVVPKLIGGHLSNSSHIRDVYGYYNFSFPSNLQCFIKIRDKIKEKPDYTTRLLTRLYNETGSLQPLKTQDSDSSAQNDAIIAWE